jgi:hypothetical protein
MHCVAAVALQRPFGKAGVFCRDNPQKELTQQMKHQATRNRSAASAFDTRAPT